MTTLSGGHAVVEVLAREGVRKVFSVPGESYLGVLDGLYQHPSIQLIVNRHEGGASFMAEAYAKASGEVGVCAATRGVGSANLAIGLHTAMQDSTPVVALVGQIERPFQYREAFQEVNLAGWFSHICKWAIQIDDAKRIPELLHRAFAVARSGRPGPVVVALPHDMLEDPCTAEPIQPYRIPAPAAPADTVAAVWEALRQAEKPVILAGGGVLRAGATPKLVALAERLQIPVVTAFRRFDAFPNTHPCYIGWLGFGPAPHVLETLRTADLVVAIGTRFSQVTTQDYRLLPPDARLVHVDIAPEVLGRVYPPALPVVSDAGLFLDALLARVPAEPTEAAAARTAWIAGLHQRYLEHSTPPADFRDDVVDLDGFMHDLNRILPDDAILTSDAGNFFGWLVRYRRFTRPGTYVGPTSGAMGYGLPAAIGAKLAHPDRMVVSFSGDGGFLMTFQELETAVRHQVPVVAVVVNNNLYGTIRAHQERQFPGRVVGTELHNPNFAELARTFGAFGMRVTRNQDVRPAFEEAVACGRPAVIEVMTDPAILSVGQPKR
ncbi:thiamine pyrophosphate-dependent enzyme [Alicyclobacillus sp.]|uniref:thiamine pyrophosphate-dependent enzyme n=1 Tax=Alicyclobacillus sp. TaxID=61169 RepID=UPI0025C5A95F|nr:thiamine pyrophosphate-dependent enzyme [Alicyclobacillus sp.]MCL6518035.1 acetolactate synthase [Alicyclobacillus sp.]